MPRSCDRSAPASAPASVPDRGALRRLAAAVVVAGVVPGLLAPSAAVAQQSAVAAAPAAAGRIEGRVTSPAGAPLADVMVFVQGQPRGGITDEAGRFVIQGVPAGEWTLVARRAGLGERTSPVRVTGDVARVDFQLAERAAVVAPVVVSASRESQRRAEASATVDVLDGAEVRLARAAHPAQVMKRIPGVYVSQLSGEGHSMAIRQPITTKPMYLYLEDGVPTRATGFFNHNALYEVNVPQSGGIEVLKGPGTALYGSDAIGGVVNVLTRPAPASPSGDVAIEGGGQGYQRMLASGGTTRGRDGVRADVNLTRMDGWRDASAYDRQSGTVRWDHVGGVTLRTVVTGTRVDQRDLLSLDHAQFETRSPVNRSPLAYREVSALRASTAIEKETGATSWSLTPYVRRNVLKLLPNWQLTFDPQEWDTRSTSVGALLKVRRDFAPLRARVIAGADVDWTPGSFTADSLRVYRSGTGSAAIYDSATATRRLYDYDVTYRQASPYAQVELSPVSRLRLDAGLRWDVAGYRYRTNLAATQEGRWRVPGDTSLTYTRLSPKAGVTYEASPALALFGSWRSGFRAPSQSQLFQQGSAANTVSLAPVTVGSWEGGARGQLGRRVLYQLSAYDMTISNDILTYTRPDGLREARNAGRTRHRGVETSVSAMLVPTVKLDVAYSASEQRYVTYAPQAARNGLPEVSFAGLRIEQAPSQLANALLTWSPRFLHGGRLAAEWSHAGRYVAGYRFDAQGQPTDPVWYGGHQLWNLHANAQLLPQVELFARVMNLTDRTFAEVAAFNANDKVQPDQLTPGAPRTVYAGLRWGWAR